MDKKDIYEHLAKIYLDASSKKKKKSKARLPFFRKPFFIIGVSVFAFGAFFFFAFNRKHTLKSEIALLLQTDAAKINFHFDPAKKETYSLDLNKLDITRFKALGFSVKKVNSTGMISLRVEFINDFKEKSEVYFRDIPFRWQDYKIELSKFKNIGDWSSMVHLAFIVEEWNVKEKKGIVYIDNVRLLR